MYFAEFELDMPKTEVRLYDERIKLLLGHYDIHKGVKRIFTHSTHLELLSRKIAFQMHFDRSRSILQKNGLELAIKILRDEIGEKRAIQAFNELIDPCNILFPLASGNELTFGHLRYQEHLAATEIASNRGVDIIELLKNEWWRGAFGLCHK